MSTFRRKSTEQEIKGTAQKIKGVGQEIVGRATGSERMRAKGEANQVAGPARRGGRSAQRSSARRRRRVGASESRLRCDLSPAG